MQSRALRVTHRSVPVTQQLARIRHRHGDSALSRDSHPAEASRRGVGLTRLHAYFGVARFARGLVRGRVNDENYGFATAGARNMGRPYGCSTTLMQQSSLSRNVLYIAGPWWSGNRAGEPVPPKVDGVPRTHWRAFPIA